MADTMPHWCNGKGHMSDNFLLDPSWVRATTLAERAASTLDSASSIDHTQAEQRMQRWKAQHPFIDNTIFTQRLASDGLTDQALFHQLGEPNETAHARWI